MCNYLKNMVGYKHNQLRHKSFVDIQKLFDKALKRVNTFVPMDTEKVEGSKAKAAGSDTRVEESSKRARKELDRESIKKQKITRDERKIYYHITRADRSTQVYMRFEDMLKMFDKEDLEVLYRIMKDRFKSTKPVGDNIVLLGNLMTLFEQSASDEIRMWEGKLQVDYECKMAFELLRNRPEGCIAEETIAKEIIEFFSEYHKSMETIGIPPDKHETDENEEGKPLSAGKSSEVSAELFQKAYLRHMQVLKTENLGKRIAFLENEHSKSFSKWLRKEVERELVISKESVSETVRWISYGPRATIVKYDAYNINGYNFHTKCHDGKFYQNSGVSVIRKSK
ncbi:hypothetical protein Tco_0281422 [Tanacetum coccineum]